MKQEMKDDLVGVSLGILGMFIFGFAMIGARKIIPDFISWLGL
jgi:hypothetical protein